MNRRASCRQLALVLCAAAAVGRGALAQAPGGLPRIGVLRWGAPGDEAQAKLSAALLALGYDEGRTVAIEWRFATNRELARRHAAELATMRLDLILASATPAALAVKEAAGTTPVVLAGAADPVGAGLVASLARPGANVTGVSSNLPDMVPKQLQLLGELIAGLRRVGFLGSTEDPATRLFVARAREAAALLGVSMQVELIRHAGAAAPALDAMVNGQAQAVIVQPLFAVSNRERLPEQLLRYRLPAVTAQATFAAAGGLMAYGFSQDDLSRRAASFVDRILKGAEPASLPVEEPTSYDLVINLAVAKALGITIPPPLLLRASRLIA